MVTEIPAARVQSLNSFVPFSVFSSTAQSRVGGEEKSPCTLLFFRLSVKAAQVLKLFDDELAAMKKNRRRAG